MRNPCLLFAGGNRINRRILLLCSAVGLVSGCGRDSVDLLRGNVQAVAPAQLVAEQTLITGSQVTSSVKLAYRHDLSVEMSADRIAPRFERARTSCVEDQSLKCNLIEATITVGDANAGVRPSATLSIRLPHDTIARFETLLLEPLQGEGQGEPSVRSRSTNAEDLTFQLLDLDRRLAQATDYRDRLTVLSMRTDAALNDLIKVQEKLSEVQSSIEEMTAETRRLNTRVDTELLNISLNPYASLANVSSPLAEAWRNSARVLGESTASAFTFVIVILPWLPLLGLGVFILAWLWRVSQRRRRQHSTAPAVQ